MAWTRAVVTEVESAEPHTFGRCSNVSDKRAGQLLGIRGSKDQEQGPGFSWSTGCKVEPRPARGGWRGGRQGPGVPLGCGKSEMRAARFSGGGKKAVGSVSLEIRGLIDQDRRVKAIVMVSKTLGLCPPLRVCRCST